MHVQTFPMHPRYRRGMIGGGMIGAKRTSGQPGGPEPFTQRVEITVTVHRE